MRVAVIGGTGFVGRHVAAELAARGHEVSGVARRTAPDWRHRFHAADATREGELEEALAGCDAAVWAAGSLWQSRGQTFHDIHVKGVRQLVAACRARRVRRLVMVSSLGARQQSRSDFHRAKWSGEELGRRSLLDVTVVRPSVMFGAGDHFVAPLGRMLRRMPLALLPGRGEALLAPVAAFDLARAVAEALERGETIGAAYDLPGPEALTIAAVYDRVMAALGLRRARVGVPYAVIEPLSHLLRRSPGVPFTFDHLAILEEEQPAARASGWAAFAIVPSSFTVEAIRRAVG